MTTQRKTFSVAALLFRTNFRNRMGTINADQRKGMNMVMEEVLLATGNYKGFAYNLPQNVPPGCAPGINNVDMQTATMEEKFDGTDSTRVTYCVSRALSAEYQELQEKQHNEVALRVARGDYRAAQFVYV